MDNSSKTQRDSSYAGGQQGRRGLNVGQGIRAEQLRAIEAKRRKKQSQNGNYSTPGTHQGPQTPTGLGFSVLRGNGSGANMAEKRQELLNRFRTMLNEGEETLVSREKISRSLLHGARSNLRNDRKEYNKLADSWNPFSHLASSVFSNTKATFRKQVKMSERMVRDHENRVDALGKAIGTESERAKAKEQVLKKIEERLLVEEKLLQLRQKHSEASGNKLLSAQLKNEISVVESRWNQLRRESDQAFGGLLKRFATGDPSAMFAKQRAQLRGMNKDFTDCIDSLDTTEEWARLGVEVAIMVGAGSVAMATAGAGTPLLYAALYAGGTGMAGKALFHTTELSGHAAYGNYSASKMKEEIWSRTKDTAWTGVESTVSGLGMGWAGKAARMQKVAMKMVSRGRFTSNVRGLSGIARRNTLGIWRNSFAVRNSFRMATPTTFFHTGLDLHSGKLSSDPASVFSNIAGNYTIAALCAGNAQAGASARQKIMDAAGKKLLNRIGGRVLNLGLIGVEGTLDVFGTDRSQLYLDQILGKDTESEQYKYEREQRFKMAGLGFATGNFTHNIHHQRRRNVTQRIDTIAEGMTTRVQDNPIVRNTETSNAPRVVVEAVDSPNTSSANRLPKDGQVIHQVSSDPRYAAADVAAAQGVSQRVAVRSADADGNIGRATNRNQRRVRNELQPIDDARVTQAMEARARLDGVPNRRESVESVLETNLGDRLTGEQRTELADRLLESNVRRPLNEVQSALGDGAAPLSRAESRSLGRELRTALADANQRLAAAKEATQNGSRQSADSVEVLLETVLGNRLTGAERTRIAGELTNTRRGSQNKIEFLENALEGGAPLSAAQRRQLADGLPSDIHSLQQREANLAINTLNGEQQQRGSVESALRATLGDRFTPEQRRAIATEVTQVKRGADDKLRIVEAAAERNGGRPLTPEQRAALSRRMPSDVVGEIEDATARNVGLGLRRNQDGTLDFDGDPNQVLARVEADTVALIGETSGATRRNLARNGLDAADHRVPLDADGMGRGRLSNMRVRVGAAIERAKQIPVLGHFVSGAQQATHFTVAASSMVTNTIFGIVSPSTFRFSALSLAHLGFAGADGIGRSVGNTIATGSRIAKGKGKPRDAMKALSLSEQNAHRLELIGELRTRGINVDPQIERALRDAIVDADAMFRRSNTRDGRARMSRMLDPNGSEVRTIRQNLRQAAERGIGFELPTAGNGQNGQGGAWQARQRVNNSRNVGGENRNGNGGGRRNADNTDPANRVERDNMMNDPARERFLDRSEPDGLGLRVVDPNSRPLYQRIIPDFLLPREFRSTRYPAKTYEHLVGNERTSRPINRLPWVFPKSRIALRNFLNKSAIWRNMFGSNSMSSTLDP